MKINNIYFYNDIINKKVYICKKGINRGGTT